MITYVIVTTIIIDWQHGAVYFSFKTVVKCNGYNFTNNYVTLAKNLHLFIIIKKNRFLLSNHIRKEWVNIAIFKFSIINLKYTSNF